MGRNHIDATAADDRRAIRRCVIAIIAPLVIGTLGFWSIEPGWSLWDSLYFTLVTITTVGYGDRGLSIDGERFAAVLLVCGIGVYTYALGTLVQLATHSDMRRKWKMQNKINKLRDHAIICGYGRMGKAVCANLQAHDFRYVVIDGNKSKFELACDEGGLAVLGSASEDATLERAGVARARIVICAVDSDAENTFIAMSVREMNPKALIASRCENEASANKLRRAGTTVVVSPHEMAGEFLSNAIIRPHLTELLDDRGRKPAIALAEVEVEPDSTLVGRTVRSFGESEPTLVFVAIGRPGEEPILRPQANREFLVGDVVIVASDRESIDRLREVAATSQQVSV